jgi:aminopeptidase N
MIRSLQTPLSLLLILLVLACTPKARKIAAPAQPNEPDAFGTTKPDAAEILDITMPELEVGRDDGFDMLDSVRPYEAAAQKFFDLEHTEIKIAFDFSKKHAPAQATLTLKPWFKATDQLVLDAKNFEIKKVSNMSGAALKYIYNGEQLTITLDKKYARTETVKVKIDYVARPDDRQETGGSAAITSDKGLYFINPDGSDTEKPIQIWTQGETESSSRWFPTIDKPNQRCTQEIYMTVAQKYQTLSNGVLVSATKNTDGTRTDYYKMDKPHAPYLFMMAVGEFAKVSDTWRGIPVNYYVEAKYEKDARDIFPYTTEMLEFFSTKLNYPFPWPSYSQIIVRDYVSGAMENTTAVIFGDFLQQNKRSLLDGHWTNEKIVAHEMFHHWFGDLVTCESWSNLTLNEGFANYSEYLWLEHKHGREEADNHLAEEHEGYFTSQLDGGHPPIHYHYNNREDMFDAVSYNKGGSILHMLRKYLGDEAFFGGLSAYLKKNEYTDVESAELRMALEEVSGEDLNWFFDQWYLKGGAPTLETSYAYEASTKTAVVTVKQTHLPASPDQPYVYELPVFIDLYAKDGSRKRESVRVTKREQEFRFVVAEKPLVINFDAEKVLVCKKTDTHTPDEWAALFQYGPLYADRMEALAQYESLNATQQSAMISLALRDKSRAVRAQALTLSNKMDITDLKRLASQDTDPVVRSAAIEQLGQKATIADLGMLKDNLKSDKPYSVVSKSLEVISSISKDSAMAFSAMLQPEVDGKIIATLAGLYHKSESDEYLKWYQEKEKVVNFEEAFGFFEYYQKYLFARKQPQPLKAAVENWNNIARDMGQSAWRRFAATKAIADTRNELRKKGKLSPEQQMQLDTCTKWVAEIKEAEKDKTLKMYYEMF